MIQHGVAVLGPDEDGWANILIDQANRDIVLHMRGMHAGFGLHISGEGARELAWELHLAAEIAVEMLEYDAPFEEAAKAVSARYSLTDRQS